MGTHLSSVMRIAIFLLLPATVLGNKIISFDGGVTRVEITNPVWKFEWTRKPGCYPIVRKASGIAEGEKLKGCPLINLHGGGEMSNISKGFRADKYLSVGQWKVIQAQVRELAKIPNQKIYMEF